MYHGRRWCAFGACLVGSFSTNAHAAGPYAVDDATIGDVGECHVESWFSAADNGDIVILTQPACVIRLGVPVEFTTTLQGVCVEGLWATLLGLQGKFILLPFDARGLAIAMAIGTPADACATARPRTSTSILSMATTSPARTRTGSPQR